jgi:hypothetical protein
VGKNDGVRENNMRLETAWEKIILFSRRSHLQVFGFIYAGCGFLLIGFGNAGGKCGGKYRSGRNN